MKWLIIFTDSYPHCFHFSPLPINFSIFFLDLAQFSFYLCLKPSSVFLTTGAVMVTVIIHAVECLFPYSQCL